MRSKPKNRLSVHAEPSVVFEPDTFVLRPAAGALITPRSAARGPRMNTLKRPRRAVVCHPERKRTIDI